MDSLEAARRIEDHLREHHMKERPRCEKITEALSLAIKTLKQFGKLGGYVDEFTGVKIMCFTPNPDEAIIIRFNANKDKLDFIRAVFESLRDTFPHNSIAILPKDMDLQRMRKAELLQFKAQINELLEVVEE